MTGIIEKIPDGLAKTVASNMEPGEAIVFQLKGAFKEALICTDRRVIIVKSGFMTGQIFGTDLFQLSYASVASAQVKFHLLTGYFEVSAGGMQNTEKSYWSQNRNLDAKRAPNCVSTNSRNQSTRFQAAASFIMKKSGEARTVGAPVSGADVAGSLDRLWTLKQQGALSQSEYEAAKTRLLAG